MLGIYIAVQILISSILLRCIYLRYFHPLSRYPGPFFASFTNLWYVIRRPLHFHVSAADCFHRNFFTYFSGKAHLVEQTLHEFYGNVVRTGPNSLSFSSLAAFEAIYGFNRSLEKGDFYNFGRDGQGESIFSARTSAAHREHTRKVVWPLLWPESYEPVISEHLSTFLEQLTTHTRSKDDSTLNIARHIHRFTFNTIVEIIYGDPIFVQPYSNNEGTSDVLTGFRDLSSLSWGSAILPWLGWLMSTRVVVYLTRWPVYDAEGNVANLAGFAKRAHDLVLLHPERVLGSSQSSILQKYLSVTDTDSKHMGPDQIFRECFNLTFAGMGSTAAALTAILYELGRPSGHEWQDRIRDASREAKTAATSTTVLLAVIKESMRLHAPFPTAFPRSITAGAESVVPNLPGPLPVGTTVASNTYILGRSKEIWGDDANEWKPERWLLAGDGMQKLENKFVVFGKGPRSCVGREIAMLMIQKAVIGVLENWDITSKGRLGGVSLLEMQYAECDIAFADKRKA